MENKFKEGDVVILNSTPGTRMTIRTINSDGTYSCTWHNLKRDLKRADFKEAELSSYINTSGTIKLGR